MKVLHVTPNYPTPEFPIFGIFVKEQVESLQKIGEECDVLNSDGKNKGFRKYITYLPKIWCKAMFGGYDVIHCHHGNVPFEPEEWDYKMEDWLKLPNKKELK